MGDTNSVNDSGTCCLSVGALSLSLSVLTYTHTHTHTLHILSLSLLFPFNAHTYTHPFLYTHHIPIHTFVNMVQVVEQLLRFSIQHVFNEEGGLYSRLGGLYLAYTLYFTQPCQPKALVGTFNT